MKQIFFLSLLSLVLFSCKNDNTAVAENETPAKAETSHPAQIQTKSNNKTKTDHMNTGGMQWMTIEEAIKHGNKEGKKYLVDVYTDWCGWCKVMDKKTFSDPGVQQYLEENFHVIKLDAEQKENIEFKGKTYQWRNTGRKGVNELAIELLGSRMSYPTLVYLDEDMNKIRSSPGFKAADRLMAELKSL